MCAAQDGSIVELSGFGGANLIGCTGNSLCTIPIVLPDLLGTDENATVLEQDDPSVIRPDGHGVFGDHAEWNPLGQTLKLTSAKLTLPGNKYLISFEVTNAVMAQDGRQLFAEGFALPFGIDRVALAITPVTQDAKTILQMCSTCQVRGLISGFFCAQPWLHRAYMRAAACVRAAAFKRASAFV